MKNKKCKHENIQINRTIKVQHTSDVYCEWEEDDIDTFVVNWTEGNEISLKNSLSAVVLCKDCGKTWSANIEKRFPTKYDDKTPLFIKSLLDEEEYKLE